MAYWQTPIGREKNKTRIENEARGRLRQNREVAVEGDIRLTRYPTGLEVPDVQAGDIIPLSHVRRPQIEQAERLAALAVPVGYEAWNTPDGILIAEAPHE